MWAELTILSLDPFVVGSNDPGSVMEGRVLGTVSGGKVIFEARVARQPDIR